MKCYFNNAMKCDCMKKKENTTLPIIHYNYVKYFYFVKPLITIIIVSIMTERGKIMACI